jgi:glycosyltransferase involved in cell wall biosynthesis
MSEIKSVRRPQGVTVTLCAIVKNETHIIREMLESMVPYIDRYDITDTGSDDGTPELIKEVMDEHNIPGEVYLSDWKGFGKSRTEAIENCMGKATYAWMIDADDKVDGSFVYPKEMDMDGYSLRLGSPAFSWYRNQIFRVDNRDRQWSYVGVLHEYAHIEKVDPQHYRVQKISDGDYFVNARTLGNRNVGIDPTEKYARDADLLYSALNNEEDPNYEPNNVRYQFYLAQSYFDSRQLEKAYEAYEKRVELGGWPEEIWFAKFRMAVIKGMIGGNWSEIKELFLDAFEYRPERAEPLYEISRTYRAMNKPKLAYIYAKMGCEVSFPHQDILFIGQDVYDWKMLDEFAATAFYMNDFQNGHMACQFLLSKLHLIPESEHKRIRENANTYAQTLNNIEIQKRENDKKIKEKEKELKSQKKESKRMQEKKSTKVNSRRTKAHK